MIKFLGIAYNKWHGIISALIMIAAVVSAGFIADFSRLSLLVAILGGTLLAVALQGVNESVQALDKDVEKKYGSCKVFQENSRDDWGWFIRGWILGTILSVILFVLFDKVF